MFWPTNPIRLIGRGGEGGGGTINAASLAIRLSRFSHTRPHVSVIALANSNNLVRLRFDIPLQVSFRSGTTEVARLANPDAYVGTFVGRHHLRSSGIERARSARGALELRQNSRRVRLRTLESALHRFTEIIREMYPSQYEK